MTQIDGFGSKVNWNSLLNALQGTGEPRDVSGAKMDPNLQMSEVPDAPEGIQPAAPQLEEPVPPTSEGNAPNLQGVLDKLEKDNGFKFNEQDLGILHDTMQNLLGDLSKTVEEYMNETYDAPEDAQGASGASDASSAPKTNSSKMLLDLYALMCLLAQCAQAQKSAQRELRQAETTAVVTSIQNQADSQRSAARIGLIAGSIVCGVQALAAGFALYKSVSNLRAESQLASDMGVKQAATDVSQAQNQLKTDMDALAEFDAAHPVPAEGGAQPQEVQQERAELQQKVDDSKAKLMQKNHTMKLKQAVMAQSDKFTQLKISEARMKGFSDINMALGNLGQNLVRGFADLQQAEAVAKGADQKKAEEELAQTKDVMDSFQEIMDQVMKLAQAILQAENESMRSAIQA